MAQTITLPAGIRPAGKIEEGQSQDDRIREQRRQYALDYASRFVRRGQGVACPTDSFYGLAVDPFNLAGVQGFFQQVRALEGKKPFARRALREGPGERLQEGMMAARDFLDSEAG